jgi:hypothetical protein
MFHSNTERLIDYWRDRKCGRKAPLRAEIDPKDFADLVPQALILGRNAPGQFLVRLAGGLVGELHQRDLRRLDFLQLWSPRDRPGLATTLEAARRSAEPVVLIAEAAAADGPAARIEILLLPLRAARAPEDRLFGLYQPLTPKTILRGQPVGELKLLRVCASDESGLPSLRLAAVNGRRLG